MKNRLGFISNSSSSSFIVEKQFLTAGQIRRIIEFLNSSQNLDSFSYEDNPTTITGHTIMDNGYLSTWLDINDDIPRSAFDWDWDD